MTHDSLDTSLIVVKGMWLHLPSGNLVQVCRVGKDVTLHYLDSDGRMLTGCFNVAMRWLVVHGHAV